MRATGRVAAAFLVLCGPAAGSRSTKGIVRGGFPKVMVTFSKTLPVSGGNRHYVGNRKPLLLSPLIKLPAGSVRPEGWLGTQLELMADGFTGRLEEISPWCKFDGSAWASKTGQGANGWEELPYWLKGFTSLGYVLDDHRVIGESRKWIDAILASQRPDGYIGPEANRKALDLWPNMLAIDALRTHYEATHDKRVIPALLRYFRWMNALPLERFLPASWQKVRAGDQLAVMYWLYNRTGEVWLLDLARTNHERTVDWAGGIASLHGVNFAQGFREPGEYYQQTRDVRYLRAAERNYDTMRGTYGQVPGGMYGADENAREGYTGPRQGTETCAMVEMMYSAEILEAVTSDVKWADRCEDVALNSLPAAMTPDLEGLHYLTAPNMIQLDRTSKAPMLQNGGDMLSYNPADYRCCQHNVAMGWPYYAEHLWMATQGNGLAAVLYAPSQVTAMVGRDVQAHIAEETDYPFGDTVLIRMSVSRPVRFPLSLRVPGWCREPALRINGRAVETPAGSCGWLTVRREWRDGDRAELTLPMQLDLAVWERNHHTASVERGPLMYSLKIGERWQKWGGTDRWPAYEVYPTTPWNYALDVDPAAPERAIEVLRDGGSVPAQPFAADAAPVVLRVRARRLPCWKQEANGLIGEVPDGPVRSDEPEEWVTLIPMGCARLRVSAFPMLAR